MPRVPSLSASATSSRVTVALLPSVPTFATAFAPAPPAKANSPRGTGAAAVVAGAAAGVAATVLAAGAAAGAAGGVGLSPEPPQAASRIVSGIRARVVRIVGLRAASQRYYAASAASGSCNDAGMTDGPSVVVVGAGAIGLCTAFELHELGARDITVLEKRTVASASSGLA